MTKLRNTIFAGAAALALASCTGTAVADLETTSAPLGKVELISPEERDPSELQVLFWDKEQRSARFRDMESWFAGHEVPRATEPRELPRGETIGGDLAADIRAFMEESNTVGVMVLKDGEVRFEEYRDGLGPQDRWTSFSVAKSFTSTLLGAALADGFIASLDEPVTTYIPELEGSAYDDVTVLQLATMTSGVAWDEDYDDPNSDVAQMNRFVVEYGEDAIVAQMRELEREAEPGEKWVYKTGETNLIGLLVENAVGLPLAEYAQEKIVEPAGFEGGLFWMVDPRGGSIGGCCLSLRLSDYARMGQMALESSTDTVPEGWFAEAGDSKVDFGDSDYGYGYQWWTYPNGNYGAQGIFGQGITIIPEKGLVFAYVGNWPQASGGPWRGNALALATRIAEETE